MRASIQNKVFYDKIPSASGLEAVGKYYYVIGDDSPFLYKLDQDFQLVERLVLSDTANFITGRVPKAEKLDLEGMTSFLRNNKHYLLLLGSGSGPMRNSAFLVENAGSPNSNVVVTVHKLEDLYAQIQSSGALQNAELNIEGVAASNDKLFLLQRGVGDGSNILLSYDLDEFFRFLTYNPVEQESADSGLSLSGGAGIGDATENLHVPTFPAPAIHQFHLPILGDLQAGFSGAFVFDEKLFFTASIENTADAVNDGEVLGSYIGYIPLDAIPADDSAIVSVPAAVITRPDGATYIGKVESLVVLEKSGGGRRYRIIAVSDDDRGNSELLEVQLRTRP
ncbi:hypothetical protein [Pontibacter sp. SGAir0037]|uniref:DUF6929 family protein n=1 Tax=Pontibacter sp. SGAir0037 TaxID=2571030 RepID=UPI0010CCC05F|nr:hypothetical protein [Pontibacter sp. SGAir0037]QCR25113.1 hypothetical protein C1N53_15580 [Pontibacter sp. SGAir0037]